jgi:hypothetical protein
MDVGLHMWYKIRGQVTHHQAEFYPVLKGKLDNMPVYLQIFLLIAAFIVFVVLALYAGGLAVRRVCFKIIAEMEDARAFSAAKAINLQDERKNFFRVGTGNIRPKALNILIADKIVIKAGSGKYYLDKDKLAEMKAQLKK